MIIKQLSVFLENKSGRLNEVTEILEKAGINISALSVADTSDYGILRMVVSNPDLALKILKENRFSVSLTDVLCICIPNKIGSLSKTINILSKENISIDYVYAFSMNDKALAVLRTEDIQKGIDVLKEHDTEVLDAEDIYGI
ncbi:ACT domain-containing protein [Methanococcus maripaludis]|uniref:Acetohydroxyacid synthase small subunit Related n=5 Tax=Methanococcus maripaludis TaxID=39152 RepID=Q6LZB3_METMP|nr:ACT domain-containing protein [Methanococcus maripaludis]MDK2928882.1 hypothetical protein [Methanococcus sp.]AEK19414.1 amino acid-binding ACT domain-containing protein [Methanococcus maripaludis X1]MBA2846563.1 hypothetical protein [Methanococcus maripaludis]MBA2850874.1 hypothetical protein [Methanococcus maripaludis]MBA2853800.1 hypothetical protein [Methanococcus maripaludis]